MKVCPFCSGQGAIQKAVIKKDDTIIFICDECDTVWLTENFEPDRCVRFEDEMEKRGLKPLWSELKDIEALE
ncbi:MAG: hypothetical protein JXR88_17660 [Clostridia bacterium]|nr:hypothetical protein [Clostridia bacterium]